MPPRLPLVTALLLVALPLFALDPTTARAEYDRLQKWQFSPPLPLAAPVTLTRDTATWTLTSGTVRLMEPLADGTITGLVFEGKGTFVLTIPDRYEVAQLRRFARRAELDALEQPFTQLVLRTSDPAVAKLFPGGGAVYSADGVAARRHEAWLVDTYDDVDARIIAALLNRGAEQFVADMRTRDFDWLRYDYDSLRDEEITILSSDTRGAEVWVSLDRAEERGEDGRPSRGSRLAALEHIDVKADLTGFSMRGQVGRNRQPTVKGQYVVQSTFRGVADESRALTLGLLPTARDVRAFAEDGTELTILRDRIGKRSVHVENDQHDDELTVVLAAPLRRGETQRIRFEYELETVNYALGRSWYPHVPEGFDQRQTARLELTVRRRNELRAMGRLEKTVEENGKETSIWIVDRPTKMITFSTATHFEEVRVEEEGVPPVIAFGPDYQFRNTSRLRKVASDVARSVRYFQELLGSKVTPEQFYVTSIAAHHGQSFEGFLHLTEATFRTEHPGASELFRAHEVAHTWWGHKVGWTTYRDQWISEALAEYCAMMFVRDTVEDGERYFDEMLRSSWGIVHGNMAGGFSKFNRPGLIERSVTERRRLGPIGHGYRASTRDIPTGYLIQAYHKGPLVLHMLRQILAMRSGSDEVFIRSLRDFIAAHEGTTGSTEDFRRVLERNAGIDLGWFFDSWIYRADIPAYAWKSSVRPEGDGFAVTIDLERRNVGDDFATLIPVRVELEGGREETFFLENRQNRQSVTYRVPARPKNVLFAPDSSLPAIVKRH